MCVDEAKRKHHSLIINGICSFFINHVTVKGTRIPEIMSNSKENEIQINVY